VLGTQFPQHETDEGDDRNDRRTDDLGAGPSLHRAFDDREQQRGEADHRQHGTAGIERGGFVVLRARRPDGHRGEDDGDGEDVDEERGTPPVGGKDPPVGEEEADEERSERATGPGESGPDGDRLRSLGGREDRRDDRQGGGHDECGPDAHDRAGADDQVDRVDERAEQRADAEQQQSALQGALAAEPVADRASRQQQASEDDRIGVDDPLQVGGGGAERLLDRRDRDVQPRHGHDDHHQTEAHDAEQEPATVVDLGLRVQRNAIRGC